MALTLTMLRCPDSVAPETRSVEGGEFSIGRGPDNDWVLPDPDRYLSKRHCVVAFRGGDWQIADLSTNGTFLNGEAEPIGPGRTQSLRDGDRLRLGAYEIEARVAEDRLAGNATWRGVGRRPTPPVTDDLFGDDPFSPSRNPFDEEDERPPPRISTSISLPADYDPLRPEGTDPLRETGPTQPDHSPALEDAFRPPRPVGSLLPDDWDLDLGPPSSAPPPPPPEPPSPPAAPHVSRASGDLMAAFLEGAGIAGARPADEESTMRALGGAFRAMVAGLRQSMIARAGIKSEFRIEQTMIRPRGNNPLKFSADDDDALAALLGTGRKAGMAPDMAVADALRDMRLHELAMVAAMQEAMRAVLARLDPVRIRESGEAGGRSLLPAQRKARAWDTYEKLHAATVKALTDDFDSVFGKAFARAYEQALRDIAEGKA
jgi:type VI secretion system protein ImpI